MMKKKRNKNFIQVSRGDLEKIAASDTLSLAIFIRLKSLARFGATDEIKYQKTGKNIIIKRNQLFITLSELSDIYGVSKQTIHNRIMFLCKLELLQCERCANGVKITVCDSVSQSEFYSSDNTSSSSSVIPTINKKNDLEDGKTVSTAENEKRFLELRNWSDRFDALPIDAKIEICKKLKYEGKIAKKLFYKLGGDLSNVECEEIFREFTVGYVDDADTS